MTTTYMEVGSLLTKEELLDEKKKYDVVVVVDSDAEHLAEHNYGPDIQQVALDMLDLPAPYGYVNILDCTCGPFCEWHNPTIEWPKYLAKAHALLAMGGKLIIGACGIESKAEAEEALRIIRNASFQIDEDQSEESDIYTFRVVVSKDPHIRVYDL